MEKQLTNTRTFATAMIQNLTTPDKKSKIGTIASILREQADETEYDSTSFQELADSEVVAQAISGFVGKEAKEDDIAQALNVVLSTDFDSATMAGRNMAVAQMATNVAHFRSAVLPFVGRVTDISQDKSIVNKSVYQVVTADMIAGNDVAGYTEGDVINSSNIGEPMITFERMATMEYVTGTKTYTHNIKLKDSGPNKKMEVGRSCVRIGKIELSDISSKPKATTNTDTAKDGSIEYKATFNYSAGTIVLEVTSSAQPPAGTKMLFSGVLDIKENTKDAGIVTVQANPESYKAEPYIGTAEINTIEKRHILQNIIDGGVITSLPTTKLLQKVQEEQNEKALKLLDIVCKRASTSEAIDLTDVSTNNTIAESYATFVAQVRNIGQSIRKRSELNPRFALIGGTGLVSVFNVLSTGRYAKADTFAMENVISKIGMLGNDIEVYYSPTFDTRNPDTKADGTVSSNPLDNLYKRIQVVGIPSNQNDRVILDGVALPLRLTPIAEGKDRTEVTQVDGELICAINKAGNNSELVEELIVKL